MASKLREEEPPNGSGILAKVQERLLNPFHMILYATVFPGETAWHP